MSALVQHADEVAIALTIRQALRMDFDDWCGWLSYRPLVLQ